MTHNRYKLFSIFLTVALAAVFLTGCSTDAFWGFSSASDAGNGPVKNQMQSAGGKGTSEKKDAGAVINSEEAEKYLLEGIQKVSRLNSYRITVQGTMDWRGPGQEAVSYEFQNNIVLDRNEKCFRQDWHVKNLKTGSGQKGAVAGRSKSLYTTGGDNIWSKGMDELFPIVLSNVDAVIKHMASIQGQKLNIRKREIEGEQLVVEGQLEMDGENAAASRGLFSVVDPELTTAGVSAFQGTYRAYVRIRDVMVLKEEFEGEYFIEGENCPVKITVSLDGFDQPVKLNLPDKILDTKK